MLETVIYVLTNTCIKQSDQNDAVLAIRCSFGNGPERESGQEEPNSKQEESPLDCVSSAQRSYSKAEVKDKSKGLIKQGWRGVNGVKLYNKLSALDSLKN